MIKQHLYLYWIAFREKAKAKYSQVIRMQIYYYYKYKFKYSEKKRGLKGFLFLVSGFKFQA